MTNQNEPWESDIRRIAASFPYPRTPEIAAGVRQRLARPRPPLRRLAAAAAAVLLIALLAAPPVRATLIGMFRAGAVTLIVDEAPAANAPAADALAVDPTPLAARMAQIAAPVTPAAAQAALGSPLRLPTALGAPDEVWLHDGAWDTAVISLWRDADRPDAIGYSLYQIDAVQYGYKGATLLTETTVNGDPAFWVAGPHLFRLADSELEAWLLVEGSVLVWWGEAATFRLEGAGTLAEAVRIAETVK